jgi:hypothetical protein
MSGIVFSVRERIAAVASSFAGCTSGTPAARDLRAGLDACDTPAIAAIDGRAGVAGRRPQFNKGD